MMKTLPLSPVILTVQTHIGKFGFNYLFIVIKMQKALIDNKVTITIYWVFYYCPISGLFSSLKIKCLIFFVCCCCCVCSFVLNTHTHPPTPHTHPHPHTHKYCFAELSSTQPTVGLSVANRSFQLWNVLVWVCDVTGMVESACLKKKISAICGECCQG